MRHKDITQSILRGDLPHDGPGPEYQLHPANFSVDRGTVSLILREGLNWGCMHTQMLILASRVKSSYLRAMEIREWKALSAKEVRKRNE